MIISKNQVKVCKEKLEKSKRMCIYHKTATIVTDVPLDEVSIVLTLNQQI